MNPSLTPTLRQREIVAYFFLAFAISWVIEVPIALSFQGIIGLQIPLAIHYLASFGPFIAALIVTIFAEGSQGVNRLFKGLVKWRVGGRYYLFAIGLPIILFAVAVIVSRIMQGAWPDLGLLAEVDYLPRLGIPLAMGLWLLTFGLAEETGWRGFALPRLQANRSAMSASIFLGVFWAFWHLPAFFYRDTLLAMGILLGFPMLLFTLLVTSVIFTCLYNSTQGSLLIVTLFHGLFDYFSVSSAGGPAAAIVMSAPVVIISILIFRIYGPDNLAPVEKVVV